MSAAHVTTWQCLSCQRKRSGTGVKRPLGTRHILSCNSCGNVPHLCVLAGVGSKHPEHLNYCRGKRATTLSH